MVLPMQNRKKNLITRVYYQQPTTSPVPNALSDMSPVSSRHTKQGEGGGITSAPSPQPEGN